MNRMTIPVYNIDGDNYCAIHDIAKIRFQSDSHITPIECMSILYRDYSLFLHVTEMFDLPNSNLSLESLRRLSHEFADKDNFFSQLYTAFDSETLLPFQNGIYRIGEMTIKEPSEYTDEKQKRGIPATIEIHSLARTDGLSIYYEHLYDIEMSEPILGFIARSEIDSITAALRGYKIIEKNQTNDFYTSLPDAKIYLSDILCDDDFIMHGTSITEDVLTFCPQSNLNHNTELRESEAKESNTIDERPLGLKERDNLHRIIYAMKELLLDEGTKDKAGNALFESQTKLIEKLATLYDGYNGLSTSNLKTLCAELNKKLEESDKIFKNS